MIDLIRSGAVVRFRTGTEAKVVGLGAGTVKVTVTGGFYAGTTGYAYADRVSRSLEERAASRAVVVNLDHCFFSEGVAGAPTRVAPAAAAPKPAPVRLPDYSVVKLDIPKGVGGVNVAALVSGTPTEGELKELLRVLHDRAVTEQADRGDWLRGRRVVGVFLYTDRERYEEGLKWVARLLARPGEPVQTDVNANILAEMGVKPEVKHGLTERERRQVFGAYVLIDDERPRLDKAAIERRLGDLAGKWKITRERLDEIVSEGLSREWPLPAPAEPAARPPGSRPTRNGK